jgi:hypothetical protein
MAENEGFVGRWARLKRAARANRQAEPAADKPAAGEDAAVTPDIEHALAPTDEGQPPEPKADAGVAQVDPASLPDVESLTYQSDYGAFLQKGVPTELRNQALQKLWRSDPVLANLDGLVEYGEDYSGVGTKKMVVRTAYRVGRGMIDWALEEPEPKPETPQVAGADEAPATRTAVETADEAASEASPLSAKRGKVRRAKPRATRS